MKILIEIAQQTNVHFFKNIIRKLGERGHEMFIASRDRELTLSLLSEYGIPHQSLSRAASGQIGRLGELLYRAVRICGIVRRFHPDLLFGKSYSFILAARMTGTMALLDTDDGKAVGWLNYRIMKLADLVCTPEALGDQFGAKGIMYPGYKELAYLHPDNFRPDPAVPRKAGLAEGERYFVLRFSAYNAVHDSGKRGISRDNKLKLLEILKPHGRIFVTSEKSDPVMEPYRITVPPGEIHSLLAYASLYAGDSQTMAAEAAVLGVPSVRCSPWVGKILYLEELERRYGLTYSFPIDQQEGALAKIAELVGRDDLREEWGKKRSRMLGEKVDVAGFYADLIDRLARRPRPA